MRLVGSITLRPGGMDADPALIIRFDERHPGCNRPSKFILTN